MPSVPLLVVVSCFAVVAKGSASSDDPGPNWPAATETDSNAAWGPSGQVAKFARWPTDDVGGPQACLTVEPTTLHSHVNDNPPWPGQCNGLSKVEDADDTVACAQACASTPACSAWQFNQDQSIDVSMRGCWVGNGMDCYSRGDTDHDDLDVMDAERMQQGTIEVLVPQFTDGWITPAQAIHFGEEARQAHTNSELDLHDRCRKQCYSDIYCQAWQYHFEVGCVRETQQSELPIPLTTTNYVEGSSLSRPNPSGGEFIQHVCPPEAMTTTVAAVVTTTITETTTIITEEPSGISPLMIGGIIAGVLAGLALLYLVIQSCSGKKAPKKGKRALAKTPAAPAEPTEIQPLVEAPPVSLAPLIPTPQQYIQMVPQQVAYVAAPQPVVQQVVQVPQQVVQTQMVQQAMPQQVVSTVSTRAVTIAQPQQTVVQAAPLSPRQIIR